MSLATSDVKFLQDLIVRRSGHVVSDQQSYLFDTKLQPVASSQGFDTVQELVNKARTSNSHLLSEAITEAMTINETFFFRDMHPFEALQNGIIPNLIEQRADSKRLWIWVAACSTGQEAYSIGVTLREHFPILNDWDVKILATDLCEKVLDKASSGVYSQFEVNRGMPARMLVKHFDRRGTQWEVKPEVRKMMEFKKINLLNNWPVFDKFDVVFLRNVLIYFSRDNKEAILKRIRKNMVDDGYLILGGGESLININAPYERETIDQLVCFRPDDEGK